MIRLAIIGTGNMANAHADAFSKMRGVKLAACCDVSKNRAAAFATDWNIPAAYDNILAMLKAEALDAVTNVTPDAAHAKTTLAALKAGLHVLCEKPLAASLVDAKKMATAAQRAGVINMINFSKRNVPALQKAAAMIASGRLGRVIHVEASYMQSWLGTMQFDPKRGAQAYWRLCKQLGSTGVLGDLGVHIYDMAAFLCGPITEIDCRLATFDKPVRGNKIGGVPLDANDSFVSTVAFENGAVGTIHSSRWATGHPNREFIAVYGDEASLKVDFESHDNTLVLCEKKRVSPKNRWQPGPWKSVKCKRTPTTYERFIRSIRTGQNDQPDFATGARVQAYLHASLESDKKRKTVKVR